MGGYISPIPLGFRHPCGQCEITFKPRYDNHKHTFRHQDKHYSTELPKAYWNAIETGKHPNVTWNMEKGAQPYQNGSNRYNLCLEEKIAILRANPANILTQRTELVLKCQHKAKYKLRITTLIKSHLTQTV